MNLDQAFADLQNPRISEEQKHKDRSDNARQLVHDIIGRNAEFFADPVNRLDFIKDQTAREFFVMSRYVNAKLRGEKPHELRQRKEERKGGALPMLRTPQSADKLRAFARGFTAIQEYLHETDDPIEKQVEGAAMATEALIIWVHPFVDGNGRTSRFIAKLIEDGATDTDSLIDETAASKNRQTYYRSKYATREGRLADANDDDLMLDDNEREEMRASAEQLPTDIEGMYMSIKRLLEDDTVRADSVKRRVTRDKVS